MMLKARITVDDLDLLKLLKAENGWDKDRSILKLSKNGVLIEAKDIIAFKATVNSLIKLIEAYDNASSVAK